MLFILSFGENVHYLFLDFQPFKIIHIIECSNVSSVSLVVYLCVIYAIFFFADHEPNNDHSIMLTLMMTCLRLSF